MRILVVAQSGSFAGGANKSLVDVCDRLTNVFGHSCSFVLPAKGELADFLLKKGYPVFVFKYKQNSFLRRKWFVSLAFFLRFLLKDRINYVLAKKGAHVLSSQNSRFDRVYINDTANTFGYYLATFLGVPWVWHFRNYNSNITRYLLFEKNAFASTNGRVIAISNAMKSYMVNVRRIPSRFINVVHNGLKNIDSEYVLWSSRFENREINLIHCGTIIETKRQDLSILSTIKLRKMGYKVSLYLVGPIGNKKFYNRINKIILKENAGSYIFMVGNLKDVFSFRKKMDIELMCSKEEAFGRVTVEGMQSGLVVIGSNSGGTPEIINDGFNGLLFKSGDVLSLASMIKSVLDDYELGNKLSKNAFTFAKINFTIDQNTESINDILKAI